MTPVGKICVSIAERDPRRALELALASVAAADLLEIRLDLLARPDFAPFLARLPGYPLLFTCRPVWEGGAFAGSEEERLRILALAAEAGGAYIDIELRTAEPLRAQLIRQARAAGAKVIVSWHDFKTTASAQALASILQEEYRSGADLGKIVTMARDYADVLRVLALQELAAEVGFPLAAFCMGKPGKISRVATLELGGAMTYAAPDGGPPAAPGQLPLSAVRRIQECLHAAD
jgi:3-dehydroquinate dehydratase-1/3-dehydroquinate dehydratase/shikimate dehydrogenase